MALYGYTRVSTMMQAEDGTSLDVQQRQLTGWAMMRGSEVSHVFEERGISGSVPLKQRPVGSELWAALQPGDMIVASKLDRMFRDALDALQTVQALKELEVSLVLLDLGTDPVTNGLSEMFLTIVAAFASMERHRIRERISQAKADAKAHGRYLGGKVPFGWRRAGDLVRPVKAEQAAIEAMKAMHAGGMSLRQVRACVEEKHGFRLSLTTISRLLVEG
jgi:putative DNA-invertase from lambdoid prophage Rac